ncbi:MerR family transcriptional regulator [Planotetraspora kaengkrachanensis]|uniref:HTH merR-type domain-containing protein n=1 Tax=Planotetraspora kaengkrachanensis TaxID=575193 RepID=A0A8J3M7A4_9ACTN|nr:MerR family transcriptional regulator [Planotetraspora kaengkrachanensis]GIG80874.1 hypothetical protein Pka01_40010 [Planotetraspora kaengkrachanensis]
MNSEDAFSQQPEPLTIARMAERTGLSADTLRYYEKAGLIEPIGRSAGNQRRYAVTDVDWVEFLLRLRTTGMSIVYMQRFARLRAVGDATVADRLALLREHRSELDERIRTLRENADALDRKIDHYERLLSPQQETDHA